MSAAQKPLAHPHPQHLHALAFPLWGGRLIEASAGTGKTWTIAALYLRLVLGHGDADQRFERPLAPAEILVMTFTRAATRELSDRIRARLLEAARCFRGETEASDVFLNDLLTAYPDGPARQQAAWRLAMAADAMDDASVFTIDAWCQRMLREHAFDSGNLFDEELEPDEEALCTEAAQDYWRTACYPLDAATLEAVLAVWGNVNALAEDAAKLIALGVDEQWRSTETLATVMAQCQQARQDAVAALRAAWVGKVPVMRDYVASQMPAKNKGWNGRRFSDKTINGWLDTLQAWADGVIVDEVPPLTDTAWIRLTPDGLAEARQEGESLPADLPPVFADFAQLRPALEALPRTATVARQHAAAWIAQRMQDLKRQVGRFGFADMLQRLNQALHGAHAERLRERIRTQFPVALIDEFQDTSPLQYRLFQAIYPAQEAARDHALLLIGDPKQSIYGFRGADIHSYLQARRATAGRHYVLDTNRRSTEALVAAVNHCFAQAEDTAQGAFLFRQGPDNPVPFVEVQAHGRAESWGNADGPLPALTLVHDLTLLNAARHQRRFAERCAAQIVAWLNDPTNGFDHPQTGFERLRPRDIAVLVRSRHEAATVRRALQRRGVASVFLSDRDSVFQSDEARDLVHWLRGVALPQDTDRVRAAYAVPTLGLSLAELALLASDDEAFDERAALLRELQAVWQRQGVLAMLRQTLHRLHLAARWLREDEGERRLTNLLHLAELLQQASSDLEGEEALVRWLQRQIDGATDASGPPADAQVLRLESDADLVKVVTMHQSKGLEYPVVCVPLGTSFRAASRRFLKAMRLPQPGGEPTVLLDIDDAALALAEQDRLREDLRLLYVAMTRPRHALWLGFAALKVGNAKDCQSHLSALGQLLGGGQALSHEAWEPVLQALAAQPHIAVLPASQVSEAVTRLSRDDARPPLADPRPAYAAAFDRDWAIASYSRLTRDLGQASPMHALTPWRAEGPADDERLPEDAGVLPIPEQLAAPLASATAALRHRFQRGPLAGNFLHEQLEWLAREDFALAQSPELAERLRLRCERAYPPEQAPGLVDWLSAVVRTPLPGPSVALDQLQTHWSEMEFWLPATQLRTAEVDALCRQHCFADAPRPTLQRSELHGMLMGFADLVFEHQGRYWVLDYKSNHLGADDAAYTAEALQAAMLRHRYDVQAAIYLQALHRLLRSRLGAAYDPATQLGGAVYLFLRGIAGPAQGVSLVPPEPELLDALDAMLDTPVETAE